jgi:hypothetical protein
MIAQMLTTWRFLTQPTKAVLVANPPAPVGLRRKWARSAVWCGLAAFILLTVGMAAAVDTVWPEWRDPEFGCRVDQLREWKAKAPERPLVVAFGSSRTQMGIVPGVMNLADEPDSPLLYNFGYRGAHPLGAHLQFTRLLDSGITPAAVLIQLAPAELMISDPAEWQMPPAWRRRFSLGDIRRLAPHTTDFDPFYETWLESHIRPWTAYKYGLRSDWAPSWQTYAHRYDFTWEFMDKYGFAPCVEPMISEEEQARRHEELRRRHADTFTAFAPTERTQAILHEWVERCAQSGIAVAFYWAPESPSCMAFYTPEAREKVNAYSKQLAEEFGVPVFPAPTHLHRLDFSDEYHLRHPGAERYSRWLGENYLKPWLAKVFPREGSRQ